MPDIERISDGPITITYCYLVDDEAFAQPHGRALLTFTWDEGTRSVIHDGDFPPNA